MDEIKKTPPATDSGASKASLTKIKRKKIELIIAIVLGVVAIGIYLSTFVSCSDSGSPTAKSTLEQQLISTLSRITGAGKVNVLITFEDNGETVFAKNQETVTETKEVDGTVTEQTTTTSEVVMVGGKPLVERVLQPKVKGVLIVAEGGNDARVKLDLIRATQVALSITGNIIEVFAA